MGEEAHIRSQRPDGPRHDANYANDIDGYENLVLLCPTHHTVIDKDNGSAWTMAELLEIKTRHEQRIDKSVTSRELQQRDLDELLVARIAIWEKKARLDDWQISTSHLNGAHPSLSEGEWNDLFDLGSWLLALRWPPTYPKVALAFENHRQVVSLLASHLGQCFDYRNGWFVVDRPHTRINWNPALYSKLISQLGVNCWLVWMLTAELTRSANLVLQAIAEEIDPLYRFHEGVLLMSDGDLIGGHSLARLEYVAIDWATLPFVYSLTELRTRATDLLNGGDPRNGRAIDVYSSGLSDWLNLGEASRAESAD
ncbi:hypothetical protein [Agreia bicolorata]|uniref:hypothetical protein n=1 Tax=Agreia bicolorata TaxID=110935 RepID=UPI00126A368E|nr:hypothetical protein [Agreia bicolorata]